MSNPIPDFSETELATAADVPTLLRVQSDHQRRSSGISSGATAADLADDDDRGLAAPCRS